LRVLSVLTLLMLALLVQSAAASQPTKSAVYTIEETHRLPNYSTNAANDVVATILIFDNRSGYVSQQVLNEQIRVDGTPVSPDVSSTEDNRIARISLGTIPSSGSKTITVAQTIRVDEVEPIDPNAVQGDIPASFLVFTEPITHLWESDNQVIMERAAELTAGETNFYIKGRKIFDFVKDYLTYEEQLEEHGAVWAYDHRRGDCTEFTNLFIALCRAAGIPAKFASCYGYAPGSENLERMGHAFALIYLPNVGWTPVDLTWPLHRGQFGEMGNDHLVQLTSDGKNMVKDGRVKVPGNSVTWSYDVPGPNPNLNFEYTGRIIREVAVEAKLAGGGLQDNMGRFSVTVKNIGIQTVTNLRVELSADVNYFDVPPANDISSLAGGAQQTVSFDVGVKADVENSPLKASVTYDSSYGTFLAEDQVSVSVTVSAPPGEAINILLLALIAAVIGSIIAVVAALLRR